MWKNPCSKLSAVKNCRMTQKWIWLVLHGHYWIKNVGLSPFLYIILPNYCKTATTLSCHLQNIKVESNKGCHFESHDALGLGRPIFKIICLHSLTAIRWQKISPYFFLIFNKCFVEFMQKQQSNIIFQYINVCQVPREIPSPSGPGKH